MQSIFQAVSPKGEPLSSTETTPSHDPTSAYHAGNNARREAGRLLALSGQCRRRGRVVQVPSRSRPTITHFVNLKVERDPRCGCRDAVVNRRVCAHIWAARFILEIEGVGQAALTPRKSKTYPRNWAAYNAAEVGAPASARLIMQYLASAIAGASEVA